jgi:2-keto-4-pentenoate hydratase/2-oxohepta-3-ene-1,7-dioic acid hydratase in catechol pathway
MKFIRFGEPGKERPGILGAAGERRSVARFFRDFDENFFEKNGLQRLSEILASQPHLPKVPKKTRWASPVARPSKIVCIGLNYADHARETGTAIPPEPILFMKATTALSGPFDPVQLPPGSKKTDWEVELAVVIGKTARYISEEEAPRHIAGYCLHNDLSEREYQLERGGQWDKGKGCDTFAPLGPWLATPDEIPDPHNLRLWLDVNGRRMQDSSTRQLIFGVPFLVSYISRFMTLLPGDVISTGTPPGVGLGFDPPVFLKPGDVMELGIEGLGVARQICVASRLV